MPTSNTTLCMNSNHQVSLPGQVTLAKSSAVLLAPFSPKMLVLPGTNTELRPSKGFFYSSQQHAPQHLSISMPLLVYSRIGINEFVNYVLAHHFSTLAVNLDCFHSLLLS